MDVGDEKAADYGCYHPKNFQTRYMTCDDPGFGGHHRHAFFVDDANSAIANMQGLWFVGIVELYGLHMHAQVPASSILDRM